MVSLYSLPDHDLLEKTFETLYVCQYQGDTALLVIPVKSIVALVAMIPCFSLTADGEVNIPENEWFVLEKLSLEADVGADEDEEDDGDEWNNHIVVLVVKTLLVKV